MMTGTDACSVKSRAIDAVATVGTDDVGAGLDETRARLLDGDAHDREEAARRRVEGHGGDHRNVFRDGTSCFEGQLGLSEIDHGLDAKKVRAGRQQGADLAGEGLAHGLRLGVPVRRQNLAGRSDRSRDVRAITDRRPYHLHRRTVDLLGTIVKPVGCEIER